jgi:hypothetical protein
MIHSRSLSLALGFAFLSTAAFAGNEIAPVAHTDPITVRVLGGKNGQPIPHLHLLLIGGYDQRDLHDQLFREERITDAHGRVQLSRQLENLPWLQVWSSKKPLCQAHPRGGSFSVELMRRDGVSAPNRCGTAVVEDLPGVFNVFVKGKGDPIAAPPVAASETALSSNAPGSCACAAKSTKCVSVCQHLGSAMGAVENLFR